MPEAGREIRRLGVVVALAFLAGRAVSGLVVPSQSSTTRAAVARCAGCVHLGCLTMGRLRLSPAEPSPAGHGLSLDMYAAHMAHPDCGMGFVLHPAPPWVAGM
jgi:hypothetical protein